MATQGLTSRARTVLAAVRRHGAVSRSALIRESGLSGTAIFRATEELEAGGLVRTGDPVVAGRGQPSALIHIEPDAAFSLGLSVMTDRADVVLIDLAGVVRARREVTLPGMPRMAILDSALAFGAEQLEATGIERRRLQGLGVALAGYFVAPGTINPGVELDDWALVDLREEAARRTALTVEVENVANAAALGERLLGIGSDYASFCYLNVAAGFGAGLVLDGRLERGRHGNAGEIAGLFPLTGRTPPTLASLRTCLADHGVATESIADLIARFDPAWPGVDAWTARHQPSFSFIANAIRFTLDCDAIIMGGRLPRALANRIVDGITWPEEDLPARRGRRAPATTVVPAKLEPELSAPMGAASLIFHQTLFD